MTIFRNVKNQSQRFMTTFRNFENQPHHFMTIFSNLSNQGVTSHSEIPKHTAGQYGQKKT